MLSFTKRAAPALYSSLGLLGAVLFPATAHADLKVVSVITIKGIPQSAGAATPSIITTTTYYKGDKSRTEANNGVTLTDLASGKVYTLDPAKKTFSVTSLTDLQKAAGDNPFLANVKVTSQTTVTPGTETKTVIGRSAKQYTYNSTFKISVDGNDSLNAFMPTIKIEGQLWNDENLKQPGDPQKFAQNTYTRMLPAQIRKGVNEMAEKLGTMKGFPLYSLVTVTVTPPQDAPDFVREQMPKEPIVTTTEVKSISEDALSDALFSLPSDYKEVKAPAPASLIPGGQ